ncbi:MAG: 2-oxoglutarate dehydrogenase E1 component [Chlamydiales bacterium]
MQLANAREIESLFARYSQDPESVDASWRHFFEGMEFGQFEKPQSVTSDDVRIYSLVDAYRRCGHLAARINPIATQEPSYKDLEIENFGFSKSELKKKFSTRGLLEEKEASLEKIVAFLREIYCGAVSVEYMGCSPALEKWIQERIEKSCFTPQLSLQDRHEILHQLNKAELFETFIHTRYVGQKRFSIEGTETLIPILTHLIDQASTMGVEEVVIGMAHRGRLNVLANVLQKSYSAVFSEFEDVLDENWSGGDGDVKYHKGFSSQITTRSNHSVHISVTANPSHLESVDPVALGKCYAKQIMLKDHKKEKAIPILIHGDSSISGQGIVYESMQLSQLPGYSCGGAIHIIIQNQIGFTTVPKEYRSARYSTSIAQAFCCPVFHVNAEDPERCAYVTAMAVAIRAQFHCDVFIELNGYRKFGHNEGDEPSFTQPMEYSIIRSKKSIREIYRDQLLHEGALEHDMVVKMEEEYIKEMNYELKKFKLKPIRIPDDAFSERWKLYHKPSESTLFERVNTVVEEKRLRFIVEKMSVVPPEFPIHPKLQKLVDERAQRIDGDIDWALAEHLAFGSLLLENRSVRLSGQDSQRGTFTQRHAVWVNQKTGQRYFPLSHLSEEQGEFFVYNSPLSEFGVMGFEFGYSMTDPDALVLWEAQFGDFANGAQVIIDQYLSCSGSKWTRYSGLVLLLPHGYEGQGSEHSSARLERFLQLSAQANWQVVYPTTPAQYFHLLRRQIVRPLRLPLVVMTPKGLLRNSYCVSQLAELYSGGFQEILDETEAKKKVERLILCCGRLYYDLNAERERIGCDKVGIVRIEQLYPLPILQLEKIFQKYQSREYFWVQEEPRNMGSFGYIAPLIQKIIGQELHYVGRGWNPVPATSSPKLHKKELEQILVTTFEGL